MTFEFLKYINMRVYERYQTLEKNIKASSNSFYDSYLDLEEELIRYILFDFDIEINTRRSFGEILRINEVKELLLSTLYLNEHTYNKMLDYNQKINAHKHSGEKKIELELVLKYVAIFYDFSITYARYKHIEYAPLDLEYFKNIYGSLERENQELKAELDSYKDIVNQSELDREEKEKYLLLFSYAELSNQSLEEQNETLRARLAELSNLKNHIDYRLDKIDERLSRIERQGMRGQTSQPKPLTLAEQILQNSDKSYRYLDTEQVFYKRKLTTSLVAGASIIVNIITSYFATVWFGLYSTFTFFENLWMILQLSLLIYVLKAEYLYRAKDYTRNTMEKFYNDAYGVPKKGGTKAKYVVLLVLSVIGSFAHLFLAFTDKTLNQKYAVPVIIFEFLSLVLAFVLFFMARFFFSDYCIIYHTVLNVNGREETFVDDQISGKLVPLKEFEKYDI